MKTFAQNLVQGKHSVRGSYSDFYTVSMADLPSPGARGVGIDHRANPVGKSECLLHLGAKSALTQRPKGQRWSSSLGPSFPI